MYRIKEKMQEGDYIRFSPSSIFIPLGGVNSPSLGAELYKNSFAKLFEKRTIPRRLCLEVIY